MAQGNPPDSTPQGITEAGKPSASRRSPMAMGRTNDVLAEPNWGVSKELDTDSKPKNYKMRMAGPIIRDSIVDGDGLRAVVWFQGCRRNCEGCHNPESWDFNGGVEVDTNYVKEKLRTFKGQTGLTLSGGEPMWQAEAALEIVRFAKEEMGWNVWAFSGFTLADIKAGRDGSTPAMWELVKELDAIIEGEFILAERDLTLKFRGSPNQRLLRLSKGEIVSIE